MAQMNRYFHLLFLILFLVVPGLLIAGPNDSSLKAGSSLFNKRDAPLTSQEIEVLLQPRLPGSGTRLRMGLRDKSFRSFSACRLNERPLAPDRIFFGTNLDEEAIIKVGVDGIERKFPNQAYADDPRIEKLFSAVTLGRVAVVRELVTQGVDYTVCRDAKTSLLMHACCCLSFDVIEYLLTLPNINVNAQDAMGYTALHFLVDVGSKFSHNPSTKERICSIINRLALNKINFEYRPNRETGKTALELALGRWQKGFDSIYLVAALLQAGAQDRVRMAFKKQLIDALLYLHSD